MNETYYIWKALRVGRYGGVDVVGFREAPASSVLAGQTLTCFIDNFATEAEARTAYPDATEWTKVDGPPRIGRAPARRWRLLKPYKPFIPFQHLFRQAIIVAAMSGI